MKATLNIADIPNSATIIFRDTNGDDLYRINSDGTEKKLVSKESSRIIISPNKKYFVVLSGKNVKGWRELYNFINIYQVSDGSTIVVENVSNDHLVHVTWSPDSDSILFINAAKGNILHRYDINKKSIVNSYFVDKPQEYPIYDFRFSKDNKYILTNEPSGDCSINNGHIFKQYSITANNSTLTPFETISEHSFKTQSFTSFKEVIFFMYDNETKFSPSKANCLELKDGDILGKDRIFYDYTGPYSPDFGYHGIGLADWVSENHIIFEYESKIYVLDTITQEVAFLAKGNHPFVFIK